MPKYKKGQFDRGKLTKAENIANIPIEDIVKLSGKEGMAKLREYVSTMRAGYSRRVSSFKNQNVDSYAQIAFEKSLPPNYNQIQLTRMTRNQLILEFARYSEFFKSMTSSIKGIKQVNLEQDVRIFGTDETGKPNYRMTREQRKGYWDLYDEYLKQEPTGTNRYGYGIVMQKVADMILEGHKITKENLLPKLDVLREKLSQDEEFMIQEELPNVYTGRGPNFNR